MFYDFKDRLPEINSIQQKIDGFRPLEENARTQLKEFYRIGLTYSSNAIEGNSLTETETKIVIEDGITIGGKSIKDHLEAIGHSEAYDLLYKLAKNGEITEYHIKELHRLFYHQIDPDNAGVYRKLKVFISGSDVVLPPPDKLDGLMGKLVDRLPKQKQDNHPVIYAALLHKEFVAIHPFLDGNGRTARLLMNLSLLQAGYPITIIPPGLREEYISSLRKTNRGEDKDFILLIENMVYESQKEYLRMLEAIQEE